MHTAAGQAMTSPRLAMRALAAAAVLLALLGAAGGATADTHADRVPGASVGGGGLARRPAPAASAARGTVGGGGVGSPCQPKEVHPRIPVFHIVGNVTQLDPANSSDIKLAPINDVSAVVKHGDVYHVFHQVCVCVWGGGHPRSLASYA